jgi:hypothetical protein
MVVTLSGLGETGLTRRGAVKAKITKHSGSGRVASGKRLSPVLEIPWVNQVANKGRLYSQNYRHLHSSFILLSHLLNLFDTLSYKVSVIFVPFQFAVNSMQPHCHALPVFRCSLCCQDFSCIRICMGRPVHTFPFSGSMHGIPLGAYPHEPSKGDSCLFAAFRMFHGTKISALGCTNMSRTLLTSST